MSRARSHHDARLIAEAAVDCADKAHYWKQRCLAAEEALSKFADEIYGQKPATAL